MKVTGKTTHKSGSAATASTTISLIPLAREVLGPALISTPRRCCFSSYTPEELSARYDFVTGELNELEAELEGHENALEFHRRVIEEHEALAARYEEERALLLEERQMAALQLRIID